MNSNLERILNPKAIAIMGASNDASKRGNIAVRHLLKSQFKGMIYPINPKESTVLRLVCYPCVAELPTTPDLVLICTPAHTLPDIIEECGNRGIAGAVVLAAGFSETGEAGAKLEDEMVAAASQHGIRIIGPNTSGIFNAHIGANLVGFDNLKAGDMGLLTQSGNMALSLVTEASYRKNSGFSTYIGVGNEADIQFHEYLDYFVKDDKTRVIVGYVEGLKQGKKFLQGASKAALQKPIVMYKSGRTEIGQQAAKSHTGALAGSYQQAQGLMRQSGVTLVDRADEILPIAETLATLHEYLPLAGKRVAILADGGGHATIAADALDAMGVEIAQLEGQTRQKLQDLLPAAASLTNPVDVAGGTDNDPEVFADCAECLLNDSHVDALLMVGLFGGYALRFDKDLEPKEQRCAERLVELITLSQKPILLQSLYQPSATRALCYLNDNHVPVFHSVDLATRCLSAAIQYSEMHRRLSHHEVVSTRVNEPTKLAIGKALGEARLSLYEHDAMAALGSYGAQITLPKFIHSKEQLLKEVPDSNKKLMVMKLVSQDILHKTEAGGVILNLEKSQLTSAYDEILENARAYNINARIEGVIVSEMAGSGTEVIIGVSRDPQYGPVMMFGLGGIFVEVLKDVVFRTLPLTAADAKEMLAEIRGHKILEGVRGQKAVNQKALIDLMLVVSDLCMNHPEISELDLNPVRVDEQGYQVLDARVILQGKKMIDVDIK